LVEAWAARHNAQTDDDFPIIVHISHPLGLTAEGMMDRKRSDIKLGHALKYLGRGCDRYAVLCNSIVPLFWDAPYILTPITACRDALKNVKSAWLLASDSTIRDQFYQKAYPDIEWKVPPLSLTPWIAALIGDAFPYRRIEELHLPPGELVVLGCTELSTRKLPFLCNPVLSPTNEMIRILCNTAL
jgi:hypothetical protein